jgi:large subunit ribosomal protein L35
MPKLKTHKGVASRIKVTASGKLTYFKSGRRHLLSGKPSKLTRKMRKAHEVSPVNKEKLKLLIPYQ